MVVTDVELKSVEANKKFNKSLTITSVIISLTLVASIAIYAAFNIHSKYKATQDELEITRSLYGLVKKEKARLDSTIIVHLTSIKDRDKIIEEQTNIITEKDKEVATLKQNLSNALSHVQHSTASESYKYINNRIKPTAPQIYPFDSLQVKGIHYNFVERDGLQKINAGLDSIVKDLKLLSYTKDNQIGELKSLNNVYLNKLQICNQENTTANDQIKNLKKDIKHQKTLKGVSNVSTIVMIGIILGLIL